MNSKTVLFVFTLAAALSLTLSSPLLAQDAQTKKRARKKLAEAYGQAQKQPRKAEALALESLKILPKYEQARQFLGWLYNVVLAENKKAIAQYDALIKETKSRMVKADALANKASLIYTESHDSKKTIALYTEAYKLSASKVSGLAFHDWQHADKISNLYIHLNQADKALEWSEKALQDVNRRIQASEKQAQKGGRAGQAAKRWLPQAKATFKVKVQVQLATCQLVQGQADAAKKTLASIKSFPKSIGYNMALLRAAQKNKAETLAQLKEFMKSRQTPHARNLLRDFVEEEPLFKPFIKDPEFQAYIKRESTNDKATPKTGPKTGPKKGQ